MEYFHKHPESGVTHPSQVCVVGDRLFTDIMMANMMGENLASASGAAVNEADVNIGSWGLWVRDGVRKDHGIVSFGLHLGIASLLPATDPSLNSFRALRNLWRPICRNADMHLLNPQAHLSHRIRRWRDSRHALLALNLQSPLCSGALSLIGLPSVSNSEFV